MAARLRSDPQCFSGSDNPELNILDRLGEAVDKARSSRRRLSGDICSSALHGGA